MRRHLPWFLLFLCTGCFWVGGADPEWWENDEAVSDDDCELSGGQYAPEAEVETHVDFTAGGRELELSCGAAFVQGYFDYWQGGPANSLDENQEYLVSAVATNPFILWKTGLSTSHCALDEGCAVGELIEGEYRAELTVTPKTRYESAFAVIGLGTIEDVGEGSATIRVTKIGGYGSGGAGGGPSTSE